MHSTMKHEALAQALQRCPVVPVVTINEESLAWDLIMTLASSGITAVEITLRTEAGVAAIEATRDLDVLVGAGTVTTAAMAATVIEAGADFVVSPGLDADVVACCQEAGVPTFPGVATPTEIMRARSLGVRTVKLFPAEQLGGPAFVRAVSALWPDQTFMPTGGVTASSAPDYLALDSVVAVGGSWMVPSSAVNSRDWPTIAQLSREAASIGGGGK